MTHPLADSATAENTIKVTENSVKSLSSTSPIRKDSTSGDSGNASGENTSDKNSDTSEEESCESTLPSLEPVNPFVRHNPTRRPINGHNTMEVRRSVRLAPKTVATLASKFDNLLTNDSKAALKLTPGMHLQLIFYDVNLNYLQQAFFFEVWYMYTFIRGT